MGKTISLSLIRKYVSIRQKVEDDNQRQAVIDYMFQIFMRKGTTEYALAVMFEQTLMGKVPLGNDDRLGSLDFQLPFTFIYGDGDWVKTADQGFSEQLIQERQQR